MAKKLTMIEKQFFAAMTLSKTLEGWWIKNPEKGSPFGPYETKREAEEDRKGLAVTYAQIHEEEDN